MATDAKFKVGDRVRICRGCEPMAGIPSREEGKLATVLEDSEIRTDEGTWWGFGGCEEALELANEPALNPGRALTEYGSVRVNEEQAEALKMCRWGHHDFDLVQGDDVECLKCGHTRGDIEARGPERVPSAVPVKQAEALMPKEDPYAKCRYIDGLGCVDSWRELSPTNAAARSRNIAALAAELSKPVTPRYPAEGRSDRALSVTNGMIRGRE